MDTLGKRLKYIRESKEMKQKDVAKLIGVAPSTLAGYENDSRNPDPDILAKLSALYDTSVSFLITGVGEGHIATNIGNKSAQFPVTNEIYFNDKPLYEITDYVFTDLHAFEINPHDNNFVWLRIHTDNMINANIPPGSLVLLKLNTKKYENGEIVAVCIEDKPATLYKIYKTNGNIALVSENQLYSDKVYPAEQVHIVGKAIGCQFTIMKKGGED
jgi:SOS-response transcriptional repressor LexA